MKKKQNRLIIMLLLLSSLLMSLPYLLPHCGLLMLVALVPLLCAEHLASEYGIRRFFWWYYAAFIIFNALTTWWVGKATVGGGVFAVMANAFYMSAVFALFRMSKKRLRGSLPYIFLAVTWIAWERFYLTLSQISWPWLLLGNAFARTTTLVQWYEITGTLGGSLWVWAVNLGVFGLMLNLSNGRFWEWTSKARYASSIGLALLVIVPITASLIRYNTYEEKSDKGSLEVLMAQSNFDPWQKLHSVPQSKQNAQAVQLLQAQLGGRKGAEYPQEPLLLMLPESFCADIWMNHPNTSRTYNTFRNELVEAYPNVNLIFGASTFEQFNTRAKPSDYARPLNDGSWYLSYNTAFITDGSGRLDHVNKTKLVVGSEFTPYVKIFGPLDDALGNPMGRTSPQGEARTLNVMGYEEGGEKIASIIPVGVPICYESIYPEFCADYVRKGAQAICVITNDGWWGNTPGYRQHFSYSRLRAIELRRDIARCANTGISAFIDQKGDVLQQSGWWQPDTLRGSVNLTDNETFFARYGDIVGRICTLMFVMLALTLIIKAISKK